MELYEAATEKMKEYDASAYDWVKKVADLKHWVKAFFPTHTKSDMVVNNLCESFNRHMWDAMTCVKMSRAYQRICYVKDTGKV